MQNLNYIRKTEPDWWICLCGNDALNEGFYPCNEEGEEVEPTPEEWTTNCYVCEQCGRIINADTLEIVGVRANNALSHEEIEAIRAH